MIEIQTRALMKWVGIFASAVMYGSLTGISIKIVHSSSQPHPWPLAWLFFFVIGPGVMLAVYLVGQLWIANPTIRLGKPKLPKMVARKHKDKND